MELVERLRGISLFQGLSEEQLQLIAEISEPRTAAPDARLCRQADLGATFFIIDSGEAVVHRVDERGVQRPVGMVGEGDSFGITSLFLELPRDATVTAVTEMRLWVVRRPAFQDLLDEHSDLWHQLVVPDEILETLGAPRYPWLEPGEFVTYHCRRHWIVFVRSISLATALAIAYVLLVRWAVTLASPSFELLLLVLPVLPLYTLAFLWRWFDWRNDYFAVSNRRLTQRERVAFLYESRKEAPLDRVQNINSVQGLLGRLLGYGSLTIETAAEVGAMLFDRIPSPERMREAIWDQMTQTQAARRAAERQLIRDALSSHVGPDGAIPPSEGSVGDEVPMDHAEEPEAPDVHPGALARAMRWMVERDFFPRLRIETESSVTWRKHWLFLMLDVAWPALLSIVLVGLAALGFLGMPVQLTSLGPYYSYATLFLAAAAVGWLWWQFTDWSNDLYIVTDERIIDIEKRPLFFSEQRREASLGMIQNVYLEIPTFLASTFAFGNVIVQTAGAGEFTFDKVANPREVQNEIFRRMEAFREAQREAEAARRRTEMAEWFSVYDELQQREENAPQTPPEDDAGS
jgi:membrane protein YdbS with pleckstrin-like domain